MSEAQKTNSQSDPLPPDTPEPPGEQENDLSAGLAAAVNDTPADASGRQADYDKPLDVTIERDALVIRIGIGVLAHAVTYSNWANRWNEDEDEYIREFAIEDAHQFAKDVGNMMEREEEDGSSLLTNFIDKASEEAVNDGSLGLSEGDHKIKHGEKSPLETW
jgi:hypothetical protein